MHPAPTPPQLGDTQSILSITPIQGVIAENQLLAERATATIQQYLASIAQVDFTTIDIVSGDSIDAILADLQARAAQSIDLQKERRMPFTKEFDRIRKIFTEAEGQISAMQDQVKAKRSAWQAEKYRRDQAEKEKREKELRIESEKIRFRTAAEGALIEAAHRRIVSMKRALSEIFFQLDEAGLKSFRESTKHLLTVPPLDPENDRIAAPTSAILDQATQQQLLTEVFQSFQEEHGMKLGEAMKEEIENLEMRIPERLHQLAEIAGDAEKKRIAEANAAAELKAKEEAEKKRLEEAKAAAETAAEIQTLNAAMDAAAATPAITMAKGTTKKQKYQATSHKAFIAIIQHWVANHMSLMTPEELQKKLSFMVTAANKDLNAGGEVIQAEGLAVVDDFAVRSSSRKKS